MYNFLTICGIGSTINGIFRPNRSVNNDAIIVPMKPPIYRIETTNAASEIEIGPDSNGESSDVSTIKFGAIQAPMIPWKMYIRPPFQ